MYADDTKIWRQMKSLQDHLALQNDIYWANRNKMKVLIVSKLSPPLVDVLPFTQFFHYMGFEVLDYLNSEKDLGILVYRTLNFTEDAKILYSRANQRFVNDQIKKDFIFDHG